MRASLRRASFKAVVAQIDEQRKRFREMIDRLISNPDAEVSSEIIAETLSRMIDFAIRHFQAEERLMEQANYPGISDHKKEHKNFLKAAASFCVQTVQGQVRVPIELRKYLKEWWTQHTDGADMKYRDFLDSRGDQTGK